MTIIAVDPGKNGGIAWCATHKHPREIHSIKMPGTRRDTIDAFKDIVFRDADAASDCICYHEKVGSYIPGGGASNMFEFGRNVERCGCIVETLGIRLIEIAPKAWQKELGLGSSGRVSEAKATTPEGKKAARAHNTAAKRDWKNKLKG